MFQEREYPNIDLTRTGQHLKRMIQKQGYSVKEIQKFLHLSCPQPVYRWFRGQTLPTLNHLLAISTLLQVHMEDLLVIENTHIFCGCYTITHLRGGTALRYEADHRIADSRISMENRLRAYQR